MISRAAAFKQLTGNDVIFGVGSYGNDQTRAGKCYRITTRVGFKDLIVQVVNQGGDVANGNFDLQVGDGGFGLYNACTNDFTAVPQYAGSSSQWGNTYGGQDTLAQCSNLPKYPYCSTSGADNLQDLCAFSFNNNLRLDPSKGNSNPTITKMCEVACPSQLWEATGLHRSDGIQNDYYTCNYPGVGKNNNLYLFNESMH